MADVGSERVLCTDLNRHLTQSSLNKPILILCMESLLSPPILYLGLLITLGFTVIPGNVRTSRGLTYSKLYLTLTDLF